MFLDKWLSEVWRVSLQLLWCHANPSVGAILFMTCFNRFDILGLLSTCNDILYFYLYPCYIQVAVQPLAYSNPWNMELRLKFQVSENAYVNWEVGPNHTVTYTKPADATEAWVMWRRFFNFVWVIASYWDLTCGEATGMPTEHDWTQWIFGMALIAQCN